MVYPLFDILDWLKNEYPKFISIISNLDQCYCDNMNMLYNNFYINNPPHTTIYNKNNEHKKHPNPAFDPTIQNTNERFAKCDHTNIYNMDAVIQIDENTVKCPICGATWDNSNYSPDTINKAIETIFSAIQNIKWLANSDDFYKIMNDNHGYKRDMCTTIPSYISALTCTTTQTQTDGGKEHGEQDSEQQD